MKKILIVGATSAIAIACAREWANEGASFYLVARDLTKLEQVSSDLLARGAHSVAVEVMDAVDFSAHHAMIEKSIGVLHQIDIALIAHGTLPDQKECEKNVDLALREIVANGTSVISLLSILAIQFEEQRCGTLVAISSVAGDRGRPSNYVYGAAKASISVFCQGLGARLHKKGVKVLDVKPGFVNTPMTAGLPLPQALVSSPEKVAAIITRAVGRKSGVLYVPGFWQLIMLIIKLIPEAIFKRLNL
jgi:short-subunit dehydrogenase